MDVTAHRQAEKNEIALTAELNHRVKNNLTIVSAIAKQTFGRHDPRSRVFSDRIAALAAAHNLLIETAWSNADLHELIEDTLDLSTDPETRIIHDSPTVQLTPQSASSFALAFHELCTNALKYGSLTDPKGIVRIDWRVNDTVLEIVWQELDGPPVARPQNSEVGYGTKLISEILARDTNGTVDMDFRPEGLRVTICADLGTVSHYA